MHLPSPDAVQILLTLGSLAVAGIALRKVILPVWRKIKAAKAWFVTFFQTIGGRGPIVDPVTGKELAPAWPPLGVHMETVNATMLKLVDVIESTQNAHARIDANDARDDVQDAALAFILGDKWENGATANLAAVRLQQAGTSDEETP